MDTKSYITKQQRNTHKKHDTKYSIVILFAFVLCYFVEYYI